MVYPNATFHNMTSANDTTPNVVFIWRPVTAVNLSLYCSGFLLNSFLLFLLIYDSRLNHRPFHNYLITLAIGNLFNLTAGPLSLLLALADGVWIAGDAACSYILYLFWVESSAIYYNHAVIAVSRMWAIIHPVSYRNLLTNRFTICLCVCAWAFPHAVFLPFWALDTLKYRPSVKQNGYHCYVNDQAQYTYALVGPLLLYELPILVQILVFPVVFFTNKARQMKCTVAPAPISGEGPSPQPGTVQSTATNRVSRSLKPTTSAHRPSAIQTQAVRQAKSSRAGLVLLGIMSLCALISWQPYAICIILTTVRPDLPIPNTVWVVMNVIWTIQPTADPIIFLLALKSLREAVERLTMRCMGICRP
ncbi:hypothetical protein BV898_13298 [Hypsibius exemplaris]|uniref:G-protein coupled receptors family 1 profile domain-containing protein n=1 Tax=Hypsibius exemplaris TaxID=2072580 RepID=A0A1W0WB83_HYPEX|nr:hypothetical protein BV898_13298 [Hypsibius exemplaris]